MQRIRRSAIGGLLALGLGLTLAAAPEKPSQDEQADKYFQAQEWEKAAAAYQAVVAREPSNATAWFRLGVARHGLQQYEAAIQAYKQADRLNFSLSVLPLRVALASVKLEQKEEALAWLERALAVGVSPRLLSRLPGLEPLRADEGFQQLLARYDNPCARPEYRVFDFWVGEWDVETPQGQHVGVNRIEKILDGCVLLENWVADSGGSGKSFNFYHAGTGKWVQTWVDTGGRVLDVEGEFRDGAMRFEGEIAQKDGSRIRDRMTFFSLGPDRVRQLIEHSGDGGRTWVTWFDGIYVRKKDSGESSEPR